MSDLKRMAPHTRHQRHARSERLTLALAIAALLLACSEASNVPPHGTVGGTASSGTSSPGVTSAGAMTGDASTVTSGAINAATTGGATVGGGTDSSAASTDGAASATTGSAITGTATTSAVGTGTATGSGTTGIGTTGSMETSSSGAGGSTSNGGGTTGSGTSTTGSDGGGSMGCGASTWPESDRYTVQSSGTSREYVLDVPTDYDPNQPYRLFFTWHWRGGNANNVVNGSGNASRGPYYGLKERSNGSAIFVSPEGLVDNGVTGWANPGGRDIQFLRDMLDQLNAELCIDQDRIFSTGFSYGGMMSLAVGCAMGAEFRAIAPMAGALFSGCEDGDTPVAFWGSHAPGDGVVGIDQGRQGRDEFVGRNGCGATTTPSSNGCVSHEGCADGNPVVWCEFSGDHYTPDFAPDATWEFFSQF